MAGDEDEEFLSSIRIVSQRVVLLYVLMPGTFAVVSYTSRAVPFC